MKIEVTQEDIENGVRRSYCQCPIAQSLKRIGYEDIEVLDDEVIFTNLTGQKMFAYLSREAVTFIWKYDTHQEVSAFEFDINPKEQRE